MNSSGRIGKQILWLKPLEQVDYDNLVENVDFTIINPRQICPRADGLPIDFDMVGKEWLLIKESQIPDVDYSFYRLNQVSRPTNIKDAELVNYNIWKIDYEMIRLSDEEIIAVVKQYENNANLSIQSECDKTKTDMIMPSVLISLANNTPLTDEQKAVHQRAIELGNLVKMNADNARNLIELVKQGLTPDLSTGWQTDSITPQCDFYNETV